MVGMGGGDASTEYSAKTNEELICLASKMYALDEAARSLLTDELEHRSIGPDEIQSYLDAKTEKPARFNPNSDLFGWIWPTVEDDKTAEDASAKAIVISAIAVVLGIGGSLLHLFDVLSVVPVEKAGVLQLVGWLALYCSLGACASGNSQRIADLGERRPRLSGFAAPLES
jgi:hypothetical protein